MVSAEDDVDEKDVVVLTDKNFDKTIKDAKFALVRPLGPSGLCRGGPAVLRVSGCRYCCGSVVRSQDALGPTGGGGGKCSDHLLPGCRKPSATRGRPPARCCGSRWSARCGAEG